MTLHADMFEDLHDSDDSAPREGVVEQGRVGVDTCMETDYEGVCSDRSSIDDDWETDYEEAVGSDLSFIDEDGEQCLHSDSGSDLSNPWDSDDDDGGVDNDIVVGHPNAPVVVFEENPRPVRKALQRWFNENRITVSALGSLLAALNPFVPDLPKDPRTIIGRIGAGEILITQMGNGEHCYFGLRKQLSTLLLRCKPPGDEVLLNLHVDGLPLFRTTKFELLPILFTMHHAGAILPPTPVALFAGRSKPEPDEFFKDFVPELIDVLRHGIEVEGVQYSVRIRCFICDAPARSWVKGVKGHSGYHACEYCHQEGERRNRRTIFPQTNAPRRTDETFSLRTHPLHHRLRSPIEDTGIAMVSQFPLDYQHLVLLGCVRTLLFAWVLGKLPLSIGAANVRILNAHMLRLREFWPSDFSRPPRSAEDLKYWRATEYRQFVLYLCILVLKDCISHRQYQHFLLLHAAITIMCRDDLIGTMLDDADQYLLDFFNELAVLYDRQFQYFNFHCLIHLRLSAERYGVLDGFSAFPFENYLSTLKRLTTSRKKPLLSLINNLKTKWGNDMLPGESKEQRPDGPVITSKHSGGVDGGIRGNEFKRYNWHGSVLSVKKGDNCVILKSGKVFVIKNFVLNSTGSYVVGNWFRNKSSAYRYPCDSTRFGIHIVSRLTGRPEAMSIDDVQWKGILLPRSDTDNTFMVVPFRK